MSANRTALITGITGQDGSYLAELLLEKGYKVYGIQRRTSTITTERIDPILESGQIETFYGELSDANSLLDLLLKLKPDEVYNIGSMSHVRISFDIPLSTGDITGLGAARILEGLRTLRTNGLLEAKYYQASSSEMYGITPPPQNEESPFSPVSPYGCAKLYAYHMTRTYRFGYKMFASNGILFNHESSRRGRNFVTQKIIYAAVRIKLGVQNGLTLGNLEAKRDWGHSRDYVRAIWMIMQHSVPDDFVVSTEEMHSVREFAEDTFKQLGMNFYDYCNYDERFIRPNEVPALQGDSSKIRRVLGWQPQIGYQELIEEMIRVAWDVESGKLALTKIAKGM